MTLMFIENGTTITTHLCEENMLAMVQTIVMTVQLETCFKYADTVKKKA